MSCVDDFSPCQESSCRARGVFSAKSYKNAGSPCFLSPFSDHVIDDGEGAVVTHISFSNLAYCSCQPEQRDPDSTVFLNVGGKRFEVGVHHHHHRIQNDHNCCQGPVPLAIIEIIFRSCGTPLASSLSPGLGASMIAQGFKKFPQILQFSN